MLPEDPILLPEIVDQIFLVAVHPASDGEHEELQSMRHRQRLPAGRGGQHRACLGDSPGLGRFFAPYEVAELVVRTVSSLSRFPAKRNRVEG